MIYIIHGDNQVSRLKARTDIGGSDIIINSDDTFSQQTLLSHIDSMDLWGESQNIYIDDMMDDKDFKDICYDNLEILKNSDNKFIIDQISINKASLDKIKKYATKVYDCTAGQLVSTRGNNRVDEKSPFLLCDYIADRDRRRSWAKLMALYQTDIESEPLHGAIWWKLKIMLSASPKIHLPDQKSFINSKYSREELEDISYDFISISLRAHNGECDFRDEIERWVLSI